MVLVCYAIPHDYGLKGHRTLLVGATHGKLPPYQVWFHRHFGSGDIKFSVDGQQDFT